MKGLTSSHLFRCSIAVLATAVFAITSPQVVLSQSVRSITRSISTYKNIQQRWIEIRLADQRLLAWEGKKQVYAVIVSTGKADTPTLPGVFAIQSKYRFARMQGENYDISDVPYTMYYSGGYGIHGAYWHDRFGTPVSHGCVNVAVDHARWLFRWLFNWAEVGTPIVVH